MPKLPIRRNGRAQVEDNGRDHTQVPEMRASGNRGGCISGSGGGRVVEVIGGGLAGCEAAWALAERGVRVEVTELPSPGIVATGPLTSDALADKIAKRLGVESLAFYDAIAPIVSADSLDRNRLFKLSRYGKGGGDDYWNAPFTKETYDAFI